MQTRQYWEKQLYELGTRKPELWEGTRQRLLAAADLFTAEDENAWTYMYINEIGWYLDGEESPDHIVPRLQRLQGMLHIDALGPPTEKTLSSLTEIASTCPHERVAIL